MIGYGSRVRLHYEIRLEDGTLVDSSFDDEPMEITIGGGDIESGLELALIGLGPGDRETIVIPPGQAFGLPDEAAVQTLPRETFPPDMALAPGVVVQFDTPAGDAVPGLIRSVAEDAVTVDFNHPLAGRELSFTVEILDVGTGPAP